MGWNKYIIVNQLGHEVPILFSSLLAHSDLALLSAVSAGMFQVQSKDGKMEVTTFGHSPTLKLYSRPEDEEIIQKFLRNPGS